MKKNLYDNFLGIMIGTAVGDSLGLPFEGMSNKRIEKICKGKWRQRLILNKGMISDDTEHTIFIAQSLLEYPDNANQFAKRFAWCLKFWFLNIPVSIGFSTLKSILKLWIGFGPKNSGVFSAGNGPAMRVSPIGAFFAANKELLDEYVTISTQITHTDPKALTGSKAVAYIISWIIREKLTIKPELEEFLKILNSVGPKDKEWLEIIDIIKKSCRENLTVKNFTKTLGIEKGVTGYIYHTVPVAIYAWYIHFGDFKKTLSAVLDCGNDTDTVGAITGAMAGCLVGKNGIPKNWIDNMIDWPRGIKTLEKIAKNLSLRGKKVKYFWPGLILRNFIFLMIVLLHALRRLIPPY